MTTYRKIYNQLLEAKFRLMDCKLRSHTTDYYLCSESLTQAIIECDTLASLEEQSRYQAKNTFMNMVNKSA